MDPIGFGIIRQPYFNLLGLLFNPLLDISEYEFEIINPEYIDGSYVTGAGQILSEAAFSYAVQDVSKYDYVLLPIALKGTINTRRTGFRADPNSGAINTQANIAANSNGPGLYSTAYFLTDVDDSMPYAVVNALSDWHPPIIGFIRHRNDGVNPKSIKPLEDIEFPDPDLKKKEDEDTEDTVDTEDT